MNTFDAQSKIVDLCNFPILTIHNSWHHKWFFKRVSNMCITIQIQYMKKIDVQILWITNTTHQVVLMMPMHSDNQYHRLMFFSWNSSLNHMCNWSRCCKLWIVRIQCYIGSMCIWSQIYMIVLFLFSGNKLTLTDMMRMYCTILNSLLHLLYVCILHGYKTAWTQHTVCARVIYACMNSPPNLYIM